MKRMFLLAVLLVASSAPALAQTVRNDYQNINLVETLEAAGNFKTLLTALHKAGLIETLKGPGPFTILAPNDEAFANLPPGKLDDIIRNPTELRKLLLYHVAAGKFSLKDLLSRTDRSITMMENTKVEILCNGFSYPRAQPQNRIVETAFGPITSAAKDDRLKPANSQSKAGILWKSRVSVSLPYSCLIAV